MGTDPKKIQSRHWCVTVNALKDDGGEFTETFIQEAEDSLEHLVHCKQVRYAVFGVEQGENAEVQHLQMYVEFMRPKRMSEAKATLGWSWAHLEPRWGTRDQCRDYCMKDDETSLGYIHEAGVWRTSGDGLKARNRTLADCCVDALLKGMTPYQVAKMYPAAFFAHSRKVWDLYRALKGPECAMEE